MFFVVIETVLQFLPVHSRIQGISTDSLFPIVRAQPRQEYVYSFGWDFLNVTRGRTNNVGMFNSADYAKEHPAVAVVGDSYIEARMLPYGDTLQGHLEKKLAPYGLRVFAASSGGAGLADYAGFAGMLRRELRLQALVVLVGEGDLLEVLASPDPGYMGMRCEAGHVSMYGAPYRRAPRTLLRKIAGASALVRYAEFNLKANIWLHGALNRHAESAKSIEVPTEACLSDYLQQLKSEAGLDSSHILFVVDGLRGKYDARHDAQRIMQAEAIRGEFIALARSLGFPVVDMQPIFTHARQVERLRVDFNPRDNHWNGVGHRIAADAVEGAFLSKGVPGDHVRAETSLVPR